MVQSHSQQAGHDAASGNSYLPDAIDCHIAHEFMQVGSNGKYFQSAQLFQQTVIEKRT
jgi:hypothetical protein